MENFQLNRAASCPKCQFKCQSYKFSVTKKKRILAEACCSELVDSVCDAVKRSRGERRRAAGKNTIAL